MRKAKTQLKTIDSAVYGYKDALFKSFYSSHLYVDVAKRWRGLGLVYLLLVIAVFSLPYGIKISMNIGKAFEEQMLDPLRQLPLLYVQNGELSFDKPMPYYIRNEKGQIVTIIDTTGKINQFDPGYPYLTLLFNKNQMTIRLPTPNVLNPDIPLPNDGPPYTQPFDKSSNLVFNGKKMAEENGVQFLKYGAQLIATPVVISVMFSVMMVVLMVIALIGQVFSLTFYSYKISYAMAARLIMVSSTPMLLVLIILMYLNDLFFGLGYILLGLLFAYFSYALFAVRADSQKVARL